MIDTTRLNWDKVGGMVPAIVQGCDGRVRMVGYMDRDALTATIETGYVTFFSRSKGRLWVKGETSGNRLRLLSAHADCDGDALLVMVDPEGPTCHTGAATCFGDVVGPFFPAQLEDILLQRSAADPADSYTARLVADGVKRIAQKVGEEGVEVSLAAVAGDGEELVAEVADLAYHLTLLLNISGKCWSNVAAELERRHTASNDTASS